MLGRDFYKLESDVEISNERLRSLVFFYAPLIGPEALYLYEHLVMTGSMDGFESVNDLLMEVGMSIDRFEKCLSILNQYRLLRTLKKEDTYILIPEKPLTMNSFIKDDVLVRAYILKMGGKQYQKLSAGIYAEDRHPDFQDITERLPVETIASWSREDESYLKGKASDAYDFNTLFNVDRFLKDISTNLLPMRFRTREGLRKLAVLADLYNISYDTMRTFIPRIARSDEKELDLDQLAYLCMNAKNDYRKVGESEYNVPCVTYLMSLQDGKEVTDFDKRLIFRLSNEYHLNTEVINVLLSHALKSCDNRLIASYIYPIASDFHRNDVKTAKDALERLGRTYESKKKEDRVASYDASGNQNMSDEEAEELLKILGKK